MEPNPGGACILLLEDHADTRTVTARFLTTSGYIVLEASCLAEARRMLAGGGVHLLLVDVRLPDGSGLELVSQWCGKIPAIVVTANAYDEDIAAARDAGAVAHLAKPFRAPALLSEVHRALHP